MHRTPRCPTAAEWQRLAAGRASDAEAEVLEGHLLTCTACLQVVKGLPPGDDALAAALEQAGRPGPPADDADRADAARLLNGLLSGESTADSAADGHAVLTPPEGPGEVGRLGGYRVLGVLGRGGMGVVYLAEDPRLGRRVALKTLRPNLAASARARRRFLGEARAAAAVEHDHIVAIYHVGEDRGVPFLAMPVLPGESLEARLRREEKLPVAEVLRVGREAAAGLAAAHARGLVHRDVKPANLWLEDRGHKRPACGPEDKPASGTLAATAEGGRVKLLDFGLARAVAADGGLTQPGAVAGTPAYMAPEQARGEADPRSDLFGLGCVLYRAATGRLPFADVDEPGVPSALASEPPRPPRELNPEVPPALSDLVLRLLARQPADRPPSAEAVRQALEAIAQRPPPPAPRRRWPAAAAVVLTVLAAGVLVAALVLPGLGQPAPLRVELLQLRLWSPDGSKAGWVVGHDPGALPGRPGDLLRAEVRLNRPAHVYLLALNAEGEVVPLYPWHRDATRLERTLDDPPPPETPRAELTWPTDRGLALDDHSGLETIVLLARRTPLPVTVSLAEVVGRERLPATPLGHPEEYAVLGGDPGQPADALRLGQNRGFQRDLPRIDDPVEQLLRRLRSYFELLRAVRFAHQGK